MVVGKPRNQELHAGTQRKPSIDRYDTDLSEFENGLRVRQNSDTLIKNCSKSIFKHLRMKQSNAQSAFQHTSGEWWKLFSFCVADFYFYARFTITFTELFFLVWQEHFVTNRSTILFILTFNYFSGRTAFHYRKFVSPNQNLTHHLWTVPLSTFLSQITLHYHLSICFARPLWCIA